MKFIRTKSRCSICPLRDRQRVWGTVEIDKPLVALIGEAPSEEDSSQKQPFMDGAGKLLMGKCFEAGIMWKAAYRTNMIACRPTGNNMESAETREAIAACRPGFDEEIKALKDLGLKVLIPLGTLPAKHVGIEVNISKSRGSVYPGPHGLVVMPTYHPKFILQGAWKEEPTWVADLRKAKDLSLKSWKPPKEKFHLFPSIADVEGFVDTAVKAKSLIGVDIEGFRKIMMVGLSKSSSEVLVVPFIKQGGRPYWNAVDELRVHKALGRLLKLCPTMYQNAQFDVYALETQGYTVGNIAHDTMILHHSIHPELPHKLGYIVSIYGETPYWKDIVLQSDEAMWMLDDTEVRTYNARDAAVLHQVLKPMLEDLKDVGTENTYYNFGLKLLRPLMTMKRNGILVDMDKLTAAKAKFKREAAKLEKDIRKLCGLPDSFNLDSGDHMRLLLHGVEPASYKKQKAEMEVYEANPKKRRDTKKFAELVQRLDVVEKTIPLVVPNGRVRTTDSGQASCDDGALLTIQRSVLNRIEAMEFLAKKVERHVTEEKDLERTLKFIELFRAYSEAHKLATTYSKYPIGDDGRVHPSYKIHGTATGRLSSSEPNAQNQAGPVLNVFVAGPGNVIVKADYSNIEVRVMAYLANEQVLIDALESGMNIHDVNTKIMFGIDETHPDWKNIRRAAKVFVFGRSYGGTVEGIYREVITQVPEVRLTLAKFKEADQKYFEKLSSYALWCEKQKKIARETRTVMTAFGRKRFLLGTLDEIERQALNTPTQGTAGEIAEMAIIELDAYIRKHPEVDARMICTVHDSILCEVPQRNAKVLGLAMKKIMEKKITINNRTVSFPVDIEIGPSWGETEKVEL